MIKVGNKSITAQQQRIRNKRRQIADKRRKHDELRAKPFIIFTVNAKPLCDAFKEASMVINNVYERLKEWLSLIFPVPAMLKFYLALQSADNSRPNPCLIGWGREL